MGDFLGPGSVSPGPLSQAAKAAAGFENRPDPRQAKHVDNPPPGSLILYMFG